MTLVLAWLDMAQGYPQLGMATDSLLSAGQDRWEYATKIFRFFPTDAHFAYCGESMSALHFALQASALISSTDVLSQSGNSSAPQLGARILALDTHLGSTLKHLPKGWGRDCLMLAADANHRVGPDTDPGWMGPFDVFEVTVDQQGCRHRQVALRKHGEYIALGSGAGRADKLIDVNAPDPAKRDDKRFLKTLKTVIEDKKCPEVGGHPQMVKLSAQGHAVVHGFIVGGTRTICGLKVEFESRLSSVRFLDESLDPVP